MSNSTDIEYVERKKTADFYKIGEASTTDKISTHGYFYYYPRYLENYRKFQNLAMLEIGVENKKSLELWLNYFPDSFIYGIDINFNEEGERYKIFKGDQSNINNIINIADNIKHPIYFVLDDGSHIPEHQILSFNLFFQLLLPGGTYIIEDVETSYWTKNSLYGYKTSYGYHNINSVIEFFKNLADDVNSEFLTDINKIQQKQMYYNKITDNVRKNISSITFAHNCIIIVKKTAEELDFYNRTYRFSQNL